MPFAACLAGAWPSGAVASLKASVPKNPDHCQDLEWLIISHVSRDKSYLLPLCHVWSKARERREGEGKREGESHSRKKGPIQGTVVDTIAVTDVSLFARHSHTLLCTLWAKSGEFLLAKNTRMPDTIKNLITEPSRIKMPQVSHLVPDYNWGHFVWGEGFSVPEATLGGGGGGNHLRQHGENCLELS